MFASNQRNRRDIRRREYISGIRDVTLFFLVIERIRNPQ